MKLHGRRKGSPWSYYVPYHCAACFAWPLQLNLTMRETTSIFHRAPRPCTSKVCGLSAFLLSLPRFLLPLLPSQSNSAGVCVASPSSSKSSRKTFCPLYFQSTRPTPLGLMAAAEHVCLNCMSLILEQAIYFKLPGPGPERNATWQTGKGFIKILYSYLNDYLFLNLSQISFQSSGFQTCF